MQVICHNNKYIDGDTVEGLTLNKVYYGVFNYLRINEIQIIDDTIYNLIKIRADFCQSHYYSLSLSYQNKITMTIQKGTIVKYNDQWFRVTKATKNTVNLGSIFGNTIYHKAIAKELVVEDEANWYKNWQKSERYQSM